MAQEAPTCFPRIPGNLCQPRDQFSLASLIVLLASAGSLLVFPDQVRRFFGPAEHTAFGDTVGFAHTAAFPGGWLLMAVSVCRSVYTHLSLRLRDTSSPDDEVGAWI